MLAGGDECAYADLITVLLVRCKVKYTWHGQKGIKIMVYLAMWPVHSCPTVSL